MIVLHVTIRDGKYTHLGNVQHLHVSVNFLKYKKVKNIWKTRKNEGRTILHKNNMDETLSVKSISGNIKLNFLNFPQTRIHYVP